MPMIEKGYKYVRAEDLDIINQILEAGDDVRIQRTKGDRSFRIVSDRVMVMRKVVDGKRIQ